MEQTPADESVTARIGAIRSMLAANREKAAQRFDKFAAKSQNIADIALPSGSLRAMLDKVKIAARDNASAYAAGANSH